MAFLELLMTGAWKQAFSAGAAPCATIELYLLMNKTQFRQLAVKRCCCR
jgi:hypothetical protein